MPTASEMSSRRRNGNGLAREALKSRASDVLDDFAELRKDMAKLAEAADKAARSEVRHASQKFDLLSRDVRSRAGDSLGQVTERVRERPAAAVGVSLGVGLLLGMLLTARR